LLENAPFGAFPMPAPALRRQPAGSAVGAGLAGPPCDRGWFIIVPVIGMK
jgi:hypothetical protein